MQPVPAAVTAWRNTLSLTSPAWKTPGTGGGAVGLGDDIALGVHLQLTFKKLGRRIVADRDEQAVDLQLTASPVFTFRMHIPVTPAGSPPPSTSSITRSYITWILGFGNSRSCITCSARKVSRRWIRVTLEACWRDRAPPRPQCCRRRPPRPACPGKRTRRRWHRQRRRSPELLLRRHATQRAWAPVPMIRASPVRRRPYCPRRGTAGGSGRCRR